MIDTPIAMYLLFILLILTSVSLFLLLLNALYLFDLKKRIRETGQRTSVRESGKRSEDAAGNAKRPGYEKIPWSASGISGASSVNIPGKTDSSRTSRVPADILSGIKMIAGKYGLESLVLATTDGLVVASTGSRDPEFEAAHYSVLQGEGTSEPENNVRLLSLNQRGMPLIGIVRGLQNPPADVVSNLENDLNYIVAAGLAGHSG